MAALTERQKEIQGLVKEGLKPKEIGERLGISENAVYQQLRRMRQSRGTTASAAKKSGRKSGGTRNNVAKPPSPVVREVAMTPLQAIRARRDDIKEAVAETTVALENAEKVLANAKDAHAKATAKYADELKALDGAESAMTGKRIVDGKPVRPAPKRSGGTKGGSKAKPATNGATPAAEAPQEPQEAPQEPSAAPTEATTPVNASEPVPA